jgi:hypothetical protein
MGDVYYIISQSIAGVDRSKKEAKCALRTLLVELIRNSQLTKAKKKQGAHCAPYVQS